MQYWIVPEADSDFIFSNNSFICYQADELNNVALLECKEANGGRLQFLHRTISLYSVDLMKSTVMLKMSNLKSLLVIYKAVTNLYTPKFR